MTLSVNVSGSNKSASVSANVSGTYKAALWWQNVASVWKQISSSLSVSAPDVSQDDIGVGSPHTVSKGTTLTPSGSVGPYTYLTTYVSGDNTASTSGLSTSTPSFSKQFFVSSGGTGTLDAVYRGTITDGFGNSAHHDFAVHLQYDRN